MRQRSGPLTIVHVDAETGFSGGEVQVFLLMEGLRDRGHRNVLVCPPGSRCETEARRRAFEVRTLPMRSDADLPAVWRLRRTLAALRPDVVHLHTGRATWLGGLAARWLSIPALTTRRMDRPVKAGLHRRIVYGGLVGRAVAISPAVASRLRAAGVGDDVVSTIADAVAPSSVTPQREPEAVRLDLGAAPDEPVVLALAALVRRKGLDVLLAAFAWLAREGLRPKLWIAGAGPEREALGAQIAALGLEQQATLLGERADRGDLLAACDVLVLPSRAEGLGVAALEGMAAGRPVVASRVGGLAWAVEDGRTGLLVAPEDPVGLADALARLLRDPELRASLGTAGRDRARSEFDPKRMVDAYDGLYHALLRTPHD